MAFEKCPVIGHVCPLCFYQGGKLYCGNGIGESLIDQVVSCEDRLPVCEGKDGKKRRKTKKAAGGFGKTTDLSGVRPDYDTGNTDLFDV